MLRTPGEQRLVDDEHLRALRIAYLISAGTEAFIACFGLIYIFLGLTMGPMMANYPGTEEFPGRIFALLGLVFFVGAATVAALRLYAARCLRTRKHLVYIQFVAAIACLEMPYGTALGIVTFVLLSRSSVRVQFEPSGEDDVPAAGAVGD